MRLRALAVVAVSLSVLGLSGCSSGSGGSGGGGATSPAPAGTDTSGVATPTPEQTPDQASPSTPVPSALATLPAKQCLTGRYSLVRFVAVGGSTYGTGQGGDVTLTFRDGRYTLTGAGKKPVVVTVGGQSGNLRVDGTAKGTYALKGSTATFSRSSATGSGTLDNGSGGKSQKLTMQQVDGVIGLAGSGAVACTASAMTVTLNAIRLELGRA